MTSGPERQERATGLRRTLVVALVANLSVAGAKLLYGTLSGSVAMGADGLHSLLDAGASTAGRVGVTLVTRPADLGYPYGYERYESLTALIVGAFKVMVAQGCAGTRRRIAGQCSYRTCDRCGVRAQPSLWACTSLTP